MAIAHRVYNLIPEVTALYVPKLNAEHNVPVMHELIRAYPLATLVSHSNNCLDANHIPLFLAEHPHPYGTLQGHVARANPLVNDLNTEADSLVIFHGPNTYISPSWYASKKESGRVVPTWNYIVVHAYGKLRTVEDKVWLRTQLNSITSQNEGRFDHPWEVSDAPADYIENLLDAIVGIEMVITRLIGKWKISQNQTPQNQQSVLAALQNSELQSAQAMAKILQERGTRVD